MDERCADSLSTSNRLLGRDDPPPVIVANPSGPSPFLLLGDHAGRAVPARLARLGLPPESLDLHIAWDIGIEGLGTRLAVALDACFVRQSYSRLVIDCNRRPGAEGAIPSESDGVPVPGNMGPGDSDRAARHDEIYAPYQGRISELLDARAGQGRTTMLVSLHSFTPRMEGFDRPWRYGVLHRGDSALSWRVLALLRQELGDLAGDNEPYALNEVDNTIPLHADARGLDYLELEVRQDLIADPTGQAVETAFLATILRRALEIGASGD